MNAQTNKLFAQALDTAVPETWTTLTAEQVAKVVEKFSELFVRECIETIHNRVLNSDGSGHWYKGYCDGAVAACREINQHFGVAE